MLIFGLRITYQTLPMLWLLVSLPAALLLAEQFSIFWRLDTTRIITIGLEMGFISLCLIGRIRPVLSPTTTLLLCMTLLSMLVSTVLSAHPFAGITRWLECLSHVAFGVYLHAYLSSRGDHAKRVLMLALMGVIVFIFAMLLLTWALLANPRAYNWIIDPPFFVNLRHLGHVVALLLPLGWVLLLPPSTPQTSPEPPASLLRIFLRVLLRILSATGFLTLCWALVFWMGGRGAFLSCAAVSVLMLLLARPLAWWLRIIVLVLPMLLGALLATTAYVDNTSMGFERTLGIAHAQQLAASSDIDISSSRWEIWHQSLEQWQQSPIWGLGADWFKFALPVIGSDGMFHPHNSVVQWLSSYGLVGLALLLATLGYGARQYVHALNERFNTGLHTPSYSLFISVCLGLCVVSGALLSQVSGVAYAPFSLFVWVMLIVLAWPSATTSSTASNSATTNSAHHSPNAHAHTSTRTNTRNNIELAATLALILATTATTGLYAAQVYFSQTHHTQPWWRAFNAHIPLFYEPTAWLEDASISEQEKEILSTNAQRWSDNQCTYSEIDDAKCE